MTSGMWRTDRGGRRQRLPSIAPLTLLPVLAGCASGGLGGPPAGPPDPSLEQHALSVTAQPVPLHIIFNWSLTQREGDFHGQGAVRYEPPDRARLDLLGPRAEGYLSAAVVGAELRLPPGEDGSELPPPTLLWGTLGIFRPPTGATLTGSAREATEIRLDYERGDESWSFRLLEDRLRAIEWLAPNGARRTVMLEDAGLQRIPSKAVYRDVREFVELTMELTDAETTDGFPPDIFTIIR